MHVCAPGRRPWNITNEKYKLFSGLPPWVLSGRVDVGRGDDCQCGVCHEPDGNFVHQLPPPDYYLRARASDNRGSAILLVVWHFLSFLRVL